MNWADLNPGKMYNQSVKGRLQNLRKVVSGAPMQDFELKDPSGKPHKLSETVKSAKLTLLIFYSPTCGHCKEKVPEFLPVWEQYKNKGLKIVAVGNTAKPDEWATFIKTKGSPEWVNLFEYEDGPHPSDLYYAETPSFLLIDRQGTIVSRVWDLEHVIEDIHERLK
jgi:peroxiredoxin